MRPVIPQAWNDEQKPSAATKETQRAETGREVAQVPAQPGLQGSKVLDGARGAEIAGLAQLG